MKRIERMKRACCELFRLRFEAEEGLRLAKAWLRAFRRERMYACTVDVSEYMRDYMRDLDELHKSGAIRGTDIPD